ncbi:MAG: hypothetical protein HYX47_05440 [Burkholderiales bacterium]|nr:hypothetical protein [Burkholderiales bacterium]
MSNRAWRTFAAALVLLAHLGAQADAPCGGIEQAREARRTVSTPGEKPVTSGVTLPDVLPVALRTERVHIAYTVDVSACAATPAAAIWVFRVGAPYRISADGRPLALLSANVMGAQDEGGEPVYNGRIPALFALPPGTREVAVELQTLPYIPSGLVRLEAGPTHLLLPLHTQTIRSVVGYADVASGVVLVLGLVSFLLWLPRRADLNLLWLALTCGLWGARGIIYYDNIVQGPALLFEQLNAVNALLAAAMMAAATLHLISPSRRRHTRAVALVTLAALACFPLAELAGRGAPLARAAAQAAGTGLICWMGLQIWQRRSSLAARQFAGLMACLLALMAALALDLLVVAGVRPPTSNSYVFWGFVVVLVGFTLISGEYVVLTLNRAERTNDELELRVAAKSGELEHSYARLRESEQESARAQERGRLLRDMHDGLGAQLMTALRGVERGALSPQELARSLQDGLDELRLLMDSADMGYLPGALAAWRNRWDARLAAAGVTLNWRVDESLDQVQLSAEKALQVMRILQEAATNIVKHSQARQMTLDARVVAGDGAQQLCIAITDDGVGLPAEAVRAGARGLKNMHYRANEIGARLLIEKAASGTGTEVRLRLPLA